MNKKYGYLVIFALIAASLAAFGRIAGNDFINFDDTGYITENAHIQSGITAQTVKWAFTSVVLVNWHPLTLLSHALDWSLFGSNAGGHHIISLMLHIGAVLFLFLFLNRATGSLWPAAFAAALFALHPLRVESVAWAAERKDVLSMFFGMACVYTYACYAERPGAGRYLLCLVLFALSLLSKSMLVTLPFALLLLDYWPLQRWRSAAAGPGINVTGRLILEKIPFICLTVAISMVTLWSQSKGGAVVEFESLPFTERLLNAIVSYAAYLGKTLWPVNLAIFYPHEKTLPWGQVVISVLVLTAITTAAVCYIRKLPFLFVGWFWYLGTLVPVIGLVQIGGQAMADRYTYLPSICLAVMLAWGMPLLFPRRDTREKLLFPSAIAVLLVLAGLTWRQCGYWKDSFSIFGHALAVTRNNPLPHFNLGHAYSQQGDNEKALYHYNKTILMNPGNHLPYNNRGKLYEDQGLYQQALEDYNMAVRLKPDYADVYNNRGNAYIKTGQYQQALRDYDEAIRLAPDNAEGYYNRGTAYGKVLRLYRESIEDLNKAISLNPDHTKAHSNRGNSYLVLGDYQLAIRDYNHAIRLQPDYADAYNNRAFAYLKTGDISSGCRDAQKACELGNCSVLNGAQKGGLCR